MTSELSAGQAALRLGLEVAALVAWAMVAAAVAPNGPVEWVAIVAVVGGVASSWGTFRVPGDASASGEAPVPVSGRVRLALELGLLAGASGALVAVGQVAFGLILGGLVVVHHVATRQRVRWLLRAPQA